MADHVSYPDQFPSHCIGECVRILRAGAVVAEREAFAHHAWNVQGYLQAKLVGDNAPMMAAADAEPAIEDDAALADHLERLAAEPQANGVAAAAMPPFVAAVLMALAKKALEALLRRLG